MKINVGSTNPVKIQAVIDALRLYPKKFNHSKVNGIDVKGSNYDHPINIDQVIAGAVDRAKQAFKDCKYSFGLESGLIKTSHTNTGYMEVSCAVIYDGNSFKFGLSPGFEWPKDVTKFILDRKGDASLAFQKLGYTKSVKKGAEKGGIIGQLTNGRMTREDQIKYSLIMALVDTEH